MQKKINIKKGDNVVVIAGNYKGQKGKVLSILKNKERAIVEGINMMSKHTKPNSANPQGGIVKKEASIHISNFQLVDPSSGEATKIGRRINEKTNKMVRYAKKSGEEIK